MHFVCLVLNCGVISPLRKDLRATYRLKNRRVRKYSKFGVFYSQVISTDSNEVIEGVTLTPEIWQENK